MKSKIINKNLKYVIGLLFAFVCMLSVCINVYAANVNISIDSPTVVKGENVTVTMKVSSTDIVYGYEAYVQYDPSKLEFISGTIVGDNDNSATDKSGRKVWGGNGRIKIVCVNSPDTSFTVKLTYKAKELGNHDVYITADSSFQDNNLDDMNLVVESTGVVNVTSAPEVVASSDSTLKELNVFAVKEDGSSSQVWFWPNFSGATTNYSLNVDKNVTKLMVTAKANHASATVSVSDTNLNIGNNNINVVVTAEDGTKTTYTIATNR